MGEKKCDDEKVQEVEWGLYKEYLSFNFLAKLEPWTQIENIFITSVVGMIARYTAIGAVTAYITAKIWFLQYKCLSAAIIAYQMVFMINLASYEATIRKRINTIIWVCLGCLVSQTFRDTFGLAHSVTALWFLRIAVTAWCYKIPLDGKRTSVYTWFTRFLEGDLFNKNTREDGSGFQLLAPRNKSRGVKKQDSSNRGAENLTTETNTDRLWLYALGPLCSLIGLCTLELFFSLVFHESTLSSLSFVKSFMVVCGFGLYYFMNGQFMSAKCDYYDKDALWSMYETIPETLASLYYIPRSIAASSS